jgi:hypothetical protein
VTQYLAVVTEWSTYVLELGPDLKRQRRRLLSNASKNAPFQCHMRKLWPEQWRCVYWIRGRRGSWVGDELLLREDHGVGVSSIVMSSSHRLCRAQSCQRWRLRLKSLSSWCSLCVDNDIVVMLQWLLYVVALIRIFIDLWLKNYIRNYLSNIRVLRRYCSS